MQIPTRNLTWILEWLPRALGGSRVCVELQPADLEDAIVAALLWYEATFGGVVKRMELPIVTGTVAYTLAADVRGVTDIIFSWSYGSSIMRGPFPDIPNEYQGLPGPMTSDTSTYVQELQAMEAQAQVYNWEPDWEYFWPERKLTLTTPPVESGTAVVEYVSTDIDISHLTAKEWMLLRDWALADAKERLGLMRGKWQGLPVPGGDRTMDGDALRQEGAQEKDRLREAAKQMMEPVGFLVG